MPDDYHVEKELLPHLRTEARDVKDCFTKFSFQGLVVATAALGVSFTLLERGVSMAPFVPLPVIVLLMALCRMASTNTLQQIAFVRTSCT